jgi:hypothetical protein
MRAHRGGLPFGCRELLDEVPQPRPFPLECRAAADDEERLSRGDITQVIAELPVRVRSKSVSWRRWNS